MKKTIFILLILLVSFSILSAQTIGRNNYKTPPLVYFDSLKSAHAPIVYTIPRGWIPIGWAKFTPTTATKLTSTCSGTGCISLPATASHAIITISTNPVRWKDVGTPTATDGHLYAANTIIVVEGSPEWLNSLGFIDTAAGASEINVTFFKNRGE